MHINAKATPTIDTDYRCYIKAIDLINQSYGVYIAVLVINNLKGGDTHTHSRKHTIDTIDYKTEI